MSPMKARALSCAVWAAVVLSACAGSDSDEPVSERLVFPPRSVSDLLYAPQLSIDKDPVLCGMLRDAVSSSLLLNEPAASSDIFPTLIDPATGANVDELLSGKNRVAWGYTIEPQNSRSNHQLYAWREATVNGQMFLGVYANPLNYQGTLYDLYVYHSDAAFEQAINDVRGFDRERGDLPVPEAATRINTSRQLNRTPVLFRFDQRVFVQHHSIGGADEAITVAELLPDGGRIDWCEIDPNVEISDYSEVPQLSELSEVLGQMYGSCAGDRNGSRQLLDRLAILRPWVSRRSVSAERIASYLAWFAERGNSGIGARTDYARLLELMPLVSSQLAKYYERHYLLDTATAADLGAAWVDTLVAEGWSFPSGGISASGDWSSDQRYSDFAISSFREQFRMLFAAGAGRDEFQALVDRARYELASDAVGNAFPLGDAVLHPDMLQMMLDAGASVDERNVFDKTPLMYAAHHDALEAVDLLLAAGADIDARTKEYARECGINVGIADRTALFYAVENAAPSVVARLLESGADPQARDSWNRGARTYLELSTRPQPQKDEIRRLLDSYGVPKEVP